MITPSLSGHRDRSAFQLSDGYEALDGKTVWEFARSLDWNYLRLARARPTEH